MYDFHVKIIIMHDVGTWHGTDRLGQGVSIMSPLQPTLHTAAGGIKTVCHFATDTSYNCCTKVVPTTVRTSFIGKPITK